MLDKIDFLEKMIAKSFIKTLCIKDYYISPAICMPSPNTPEPTLIFKKGETYQYRLELYYHPNPEYRNIWHTVYTTIDNEFGTNFNLQMFSEYFENIES